jgi:hypothetical protein
MLWKLIKWGVLFGLALAFLLAVWALATVRVDRPVEYADITEHFKYGSIGSEPGVSLLAPVGGVLPPYQVFKTLPAICSDKLPGGGGGWASIRSGSTARCATPEPSAIHRRRRLGWWSGCRRINSISNRSCGSCSTARSTAGRRART